jgi:hypothetical protein
MDKFEQMVETIEEAEDMVECKECFDLFPKAECTKMDHGYICPTCGREQQSQDFSDVSFTDITTDLYDQEFPDVREYDSEFGPAMEERQKDYDVDDIVDALIKDEYDAIESYELADEMIQQADIEEDMKDDLLDTIEHIKEEEEEHIDEINNAAGRVEADPEDEDKKDDDSEEDSDSKDEDDDKDEGEDDKDSDKEDEDKDEDDEDDKEKNEDLTEVAPSPEMVEGEEVLDEKKESVFDKIWKPVNESLWTCVFDGKEIGTVEAATEEEAGEKMQKEFPEYPYGLYDGCFEVFQEEVCKVNKGINHTEDEKEVLNEEAEELEEGIFDGRFGETLDGFYKNGYVVYIRLPKDAEAPGGFQSQIKATSFDSAKKLAKQYATKYAASKATVFVLPMKLTQADYDALDPAKKAFAANPASGDKPQVLAKFFAGGKEDTGITRAKEVAKGLGKIAKADKKLNKINNAERSEEEAADVADEVDTTPAETPEVEAAPAAEVEAEVETAPAAPESSKKTEANKKIKDALKASGMSRDEIQQLFKSGVLPKIRKALIGEGLELKDLEEDFDEEEETVECAWCNRAVPKCECHKEVDMGWLCDSCERAINSRGETLTFEQ